MLKNNFLIKESKDTFLFRRHRKLNLFEPLKGNDTTVDILTADQAYHLRKYISDTSKPDEVLKKYTGIFYSPNWIAGMASF